jgi:inner membrane protein
MDNLAHTLVGLALADAGLKRKTALGTTTLAIGANLPDIDAVVYLFGSGTDALAFRRGWTHGILAMVVLPLLLAAAINWWNRRFRERRPGARVRVRPGWLLTLAVIGVWTHPLLDLLNSYGVRLLMPFSPRWFYGDALFIVDPWVWLVLGLGVLMSRRRESRAHRSAAVKAGIDARTAGRPARLALALVAAYAIAMVATSMAGRRVVERRATTGRALRTMVGPVAIDPMRRDVVRDLGDRYELGTLTWGWPARYVARGQLPVGRGIPGATAAAATREGREFLSGSRFPFFVADTASGVGRVRIADARYTDAAGRGWAAVDVR